MGVVVLRFGFKFGRFSFSLGAWFASDTRTLGVYDWVEGGGHVLFLDYDRMRWGWMIQELKRLQDEHNLSDFYLFESSPNSFHAVCVDVLTANEAQKVIMSSNCDESFKQAMFFDYRSRVLRCFPKGKTKKPNYLGVVKRNSERVKSLGHLLFLEKHYKVKVNYEGVGGSSRVWFVDYPTRKNI